MQSVWNLLVKINSLPLSKQKKERRIQLFGKKLNFKSANRDTEELVPSRSGNLLLKDKFKLLD